MKKETNTKTKTKGSGSSVKDSTTKKETVKDVSTEDVSTNEKSVKPYPEVQDTVPGSLELESKIEELETTVENLTKKNEELEKALAYYKNKENQMKPSPEHPLVTERRLKQKERLDKAKIKQVIDTLSSIISK